MMSYYLSMKMNFILMALVVIIVLLSIAYLTLLERKVLGVIQSRKGPNKVGFSGNLQPFSEVIKLFSKEMILIYNSNLFMFYYMPLLSIFLLMLIWLVYPFFTNVYFMNFSVLTLILMMSLNSYLVMLMGWSSGSIYSLLGAIRSVAQLLSYEVSFILIVLVLLVLSESCSLMDLFKWQIYLGYMWMLMPLMLIFFISILAELNRSPMDLIEGESELVSGFNVEYFSSGFALIFLTEYGMIIFLSFLMILMYMGSLSILKMVILMNFIIFCVIIMRGILPRMRYDELMYLCWKIILPLILNYLIYFLSFKSMYNIFV